MAPVNAEIQASCSVRNGRLYFRNRREFDRAISQIPEAWELELCVTRLQAARSQALNRYYWGVVVALIAGHTGYTVDETHDALKSLHLSKTLAMQNGNGEVVGEIVIGGSTRKLTNREFQDYCGRIRQWASEHLDCFIPEPNEEPL
jgi:hypothetical protein